MDALSLFGGFLGDQFLKRTGLGDRASGILDDAEEYLKDIGSKIIPEAAASTLPAPVFDRTKPEPSIESVFNPPAYNPRPSSALPEGKVTPLLSGITDGITPPQPKLTSAADVIANQVTSTSPSMQGFNQQSQIPAKSPQQQYIESPSTAPVTDDELDEVLKTANQRVKQRESDPEYGAYLSSLVSQQGFGSEAAKKIESQSMLGKLWDETLGNREWRLRKAMILHSMTLNPNSALTAAFADEIKDLRKRKGANAMADRLEKSDPDKYAALITGLRQGDLEAKDVISTVYKAPSSMQQKMELFKSDPVLARNMAEAGLFGAEPTKGKEWSKAQIDSMNNFATEYIKGGQGAINLQQQINRMSAAISQMPEGTGPSQQTLAQLSEMAAKVGMPIDLSTVTDAQSLAAASGMLVAEQLRLNKGPQTDFDAKFTATFFPSMGLTTEANNKIIDYLTSVNRINTWKAERANNLMTADPDSAMKELQKLNAMTFNFPAVQQNKSGQWVTFNSYMNNPALKDYSEEEKIQQWVDAYKNR